MTGLGLSFANSGGTWGKWDMCLCWLRWCGKLGPWPGSVMWCYVCVCCEFGWQVQVSVYCARRIPAHLRCTQCSILVHLIDICILICICLWQILQIQTCLSVVVGHGLVSTSPAFMRSIAIYPAGPYGRLAKNGNQAPVAGGGSGRHNLHRFARQLHRV